MLVYPF